MSRLSITALAVAALFCAAPARAGEASPVATSGSAGTRFGDGNLMFGATAQAAYQVTLWKIAYRSSGTDVLAQAWDWASTRVGAIEGAAAWQAGWLGALREVNAEGDGVSALEPASEPAAPVATAVLEPSTYWALIGSLALVGLASTRGTAARLCRRQRRSP